MYGFQDRSRDQIGDFNNLARGNGGLDQGNGSLVLDLFLKKEPSVFGVRERKESQMTQGLWPDHWKNGMTMNKMRILKGRPG